LDASVLARLPFRLDKNERYFNDTWEALPVNGYTELFKNMILQDPLITVRLELDYFKVGRRFHS
jgi:UDP-galactopyranose mutase